MKIGQRNNINLKQKLKKKKKRERGGTLSKAFLEGQYNLITKPDTL